ncbi:MAG TPA: hypothetical protein VF278_20145 [Pirellulales bacterium]
MLARQFRAVGEKRLKLDAGAARILPFVHWQCHVRRAPANDKHTSTPLLKESPRCAARPSPRPVKQMHTPPISRGECDEVIGIAKMNDAREAESAKPIDGFAAPFDFQSDALEDLREISHAVPIRAWRQHFENLRHFHGCPKELTATPDAPMPALWRFRIHDASV